MKCTLTLLAIVGSCAATTKWPSVTAHGMGDSCFNAGMKQITALVGNETNQYSVCIPTGSNDVSDTLDGFFMTMNTNVDVFAAKIRADPKLAQGFNCVGFSQGNMLCRGYIQKYNDPPVISWLSVHGTAMGVAGFPNCNPDGPLGRVCKTVANMTGGTAIWIQNDLFQADYFRDPMTVNTDAYKTNSQIAQWNNEGLTKNASINANFAKTKRFAMIKAMKDTMIFPNDSEWWGYFKDGSMTEKWGMKDAPWYTEDWFGLRTADEAGKILFNSTAGDHLQFTLEQLTWWINNYFIE
eukprot:m.23347 g.23347  ORF g.23347 m.23347 type:complete len:295 (+) comp14185_c0_seq1:278-1162(+)